MHFSLRRLFLFASLLALMINISCSDPGKPNSKFKGVQIGVITYSWRSMPSTAEDVLNYCIQSGVSSIELMGNVAEAYAGLPALPPKPGRDIEQTEPEAAAYYKALKEAQEKRVKWRCSVSMEKYEELYKMFRKAGINIHTVKFSPANWSDEEIDYAFRAAKTLGADAVSNEIGHKACKRLGEFAEKHDMYAVYHNHLQPGEPGFNFEEFLDYSPNNMLNFDVGHYYGATGKHPNELIEKLHVRIYSLHLKDKTGKYSDPPNKNKPWGEGDTPLEEILQLVRDRDWPIYCDIELEYEVPENSDAVQEVKKCVEYCRDLLQ